MITLSDLRRRPGARYAVYDPDQIARLIDAYHSFLTAKKSLSLHELARSHRFETLAQQSRQQGDVRLLVQVRNAENRDVGQFQVMRLRPQRAGAGETTRLFVNLSDKETQIANPHYASAIPVRGSLAISVQRLGKTVSEHAITYDSTQVGGNGRTLNETGTVSLYTTALSNASGASEHARCDVLICLTRGGERINAHLINRPSHRTSTV